MGNKNPLRYHKMQDEHQESATTISVKADKLSRRLHLSTAARVSSATTTAPSPPSSLEKLAAAMTDLSSGIDQTREALVAFNQRFAQAVRLAGGDFSELRSKALEAISELSGKYLSHAEQIEEVLTLALDERMDKLRAPIRAALEARTVDTEVEWRGITVTLEASVDPSQDSDVDSVAQLLLGRINAAQEMLEAPLKLAREQLDATAAEAEHLANGVIQGLLGTEDATGVNDVVGRQIVDALGTSAEVAKAAAEVVKILDGVRNGTREVSAEVSADLDLALTAHGSTLVEGKSFVDGIKLAVDAGFLVETTGQLTGEAKAQLSEEVQAVLQGQADAYVRIAGDLKAAASFSLLEGLSVSADASFEAQAVATASASLSLKVGSLELAGSASASASAGVKAEACGQILIGPGGMKLTGKANFRLGATVEASADFKVSEFFSASVRASATAGLAAEVGGSFSLKGGKLSISIDLGAALGVGGSLGMDLAIDFKAMLQAILKSIEEYLLTRWNHRHLDEGKRPAMRPRDDEAMARVSDELGSIWDHDQVLRLSSCLMDSIGGMKPAMRALPVGNDDEFLFQLHLLCRGMWKRYKEKMGEELQREVLHGVNGPGLASSALVDRFLSESGDWDRLNEGLAQVVNKIYGDVLVVSYNPSAARMPLGKDLSLARSQKGAYELTRIAGDAAGVAKSFALTEDDYPEGLEDQGLSDEWGMRDFDLKLLLGSTEGVGINLNSAADCQTSVRAIAADYWKAYFKSHGDIPGVADDTRWWSAGEAGDRQTWAMAQFFGEVMGTQFKVSPPPQGDSKGAGFTVVELGSEPAEVRASYAKRIEGTWAKFFEPALVSGVLDVGELDLPAAQRLQDKGLDMLRRWLSEMTQKGHKKPFRREHRALLSRLETGLEARSPKIQHLLPAAATKAELVPAHISAITTARAELLVLAQKLKGFETSINLIGYQEALRSDWLKLTSEMMALLSTHANAIRADVAPGEASAHALDIVCRRLHETRVIELEALPEEWPSMTLNL